MAQLVGLNKAEFTQLRRQLHLSEQDTGRYLLPDEHTQSCIWTSWCQHKDLEDKARLLAVHHATQIKIRAIWGLLQEWQLSGLIPPCVPLPLPSPLGALKSNRPLTDPPLPLTLPWCIVMPAITSSPTAPQRQQDHIPADAIAYPSALPQDPQRDSVQFIGIWREAIPRTLVIDPILQANDKCVYLLLRSYLTSQEPRQLPSYDEISRLLNLSRATVARSIHILRATRWISLCQIARDEATGRFQGNVYALHDTVLSLEQIMLLDGNYLNALEDWMRHHAHPRVRKIAYALLASVYGPFDPDSDEPIDAKYLEQQKRVSRFYRHADPVQKMNSVETTRSSYINKIINITTTSAQIISPPDKALIWPAALIGDARGVVWKALRKCPDEYRQALLDELAARLSPACARKIHNPAAWVAWASKQLRDEGIYPITSLSIQHRQQRERECQRRHTEAAQQQELTQQGRILTAQTLKTQGLGLQQPDYKKYLAALNPGLRRSKNGIAVSA